jgi:hypothetical protein
MAAAFGEDTSSTLGEVQENVSDDQSIRTIATRRWRKGYCQYYLHHSLSSDLVARLIRQDN